MFYMECADKLLTNNPLLNMPGLQFAVYKSLLHPDQHPCMLKWSNITEKIAKPRRTSFPLLCLL